MENLISLINVLVWPFVLLIIVFTFRNSIINIIHRVREFEGPGDLKISLDPQKIEKIIKEGQKGNVSTENIVKRIVEEAEVIDRRETRILRALFDDSGRAIYSYS